MRVILNIALLCLSLAALNGCGQPVCLAGIGVNGQQDCETGTTGGGTNQTSSTFTLSANPTSVVVTRTSQVTASGGSHGPYTYAIDPGSNPSPSSGLAGSIDPTSGLYTAPQSISPNSTVTITIRATDTTGAVNTMTLTVTSG